MKIEFHKGYVLVIAPKLVYLAAYFSGKPERAKAAAFFPFIIARDKSVIEPWVVNHELIHFRQQMELLFAGSWILYLYEYIYARLILKSTSFETYLYQSGEQEAYLNQQNFNYLNERKPYARLKYLFNKTKFTIDGSGGVFIASQ